ncbi:hydroxymethylglutaryl-CoA synthase [Fructilactobacillus vespulae]|uniref:hydroxymethylglutaryl-CoA synthase n=1 Tax=Fructilactobacillus vespulae TaxID=1249630 RepID=UPI0039B58B5F
MNVGIDKIGFFTPNYYVDMVELAKARNEDPNKYLIGIGQTEQAVIPPTQDTVTMAANAASQIINDANRKKISLIIFGTETGVDNSKSGAIYLQNLLKLKREARAFEIKQACYGATAGIQMAKDFVKAHPEQQALVIGSDIARYGVATPGEVTQGGGAIAMTIANDPDIMELSSDSSVYSDDIMDFWRPLNKTEAVVDGHYSNDIYQDFFYKTIHNYLDNHDMTLAEFKALVFHLPYTKMGLKGLRKVLPEVSETKQTELLKEFEASRVYSKRVGNLYTGSLYLSLLSLLDNSSDLKANDKVGIFSYGSGAQGEFFVGTLKENFKNGERKLRIKQLLDERTKLSVSEYENMFNQWTNLDPDNFTGDVIDNSEFTFNGIVDEKRQYSTKKLTNS